LGEPEPPALHHRIAKGEDPRIAAAANVLYGGDGAWGGTAAATTKTMCENKIKLKSFLKNFY
jgi:hypothetical protein